MAVEYTIRQGTQDDIPGLLKLFVDEGWNNVMEHVQIQFDLFKEGIFVAESSDQEIISACASVTLDDSNGFIAFYITKEQHRGQGIGRKVYNHSVNALGNRNIGVNGAWGKTQMYASGDFKIQTLTLITSEFPLQNLLQSNIAGSLHKLSDIKEVSVQSMLDYDRKIHPMPREKLLKWLWGFASVGRVALDGDEIKGWGTLYRSKRGYRLMPLYADSPEVAATLAADLLKQVEGDSRVTIELCFPEDNKAAEELHSNLGAFTGEWKLSKNKRMFTEKDIPVPSNLVYSILGYDNALV